MFLCDSVTKRVLVSDIARTFDVLGWFSPAIVKMKIPLQGLWEEKVSWDDPVPMAGCDACVPRRPTFLEWLILMYSL